MTFGTRKWKEWVIEAEETKPILKRSLDLGINFFDMADWYSIGESERIVGSALLSMVPRDNLVLTTKACYAMSDDPNDQGLSRKHLLSAIDNSLKRIGTDYVDIFMIHSLYPTTPMEETMEVMHDIVKSGKARYLGASTMYAWELAKMKNIARENGWTEFINHQCQYNLLYREEEREMLPYCRDRGIGVSCFSPLARGFLAGDTGIRSEADPFFSKFYGDALDHDVYAKIETMANDRGSTTAELAFAWVCAKQEICCPIIGPASVDQLDGYVKALDFELSPEEISAIDALYRPRDVINDHHHNPMPRHLGGVLTE
jgi:aryl-alcohol dehydrogenase-like predicted oxidoreductase